MIRQATRDEVPVLEFEDEVLVGAIGPHHAGGEAAAEDDAVLGSPLDASGHPGQHLLALRPDAMLERLGYKVDTRTSSIEALNLFKADPHRFDLVITDIVMPNMTGDKLADKLMGIRPDIPIVLCTGYSEKFTRKHASEMGIDTFLMKPLVMQDLASTVRQALTAN